MTRPVRSIPDTAARFQRFGETETSGRSPLYARLSLAIAVDAEVLALAAYARLEQPVPNLLFAAVHAILLREPGQPLAAFYPDLNGGRTETTDPFPAFRALCLERRDAIRPVLQTHLVQTAQVSRCATLLPAFEAVSRRAERRPLALVEVGCSAGLNLLWDRYAYRYTGVTSATIGAAALTLPCELRVAAPPLPHRFPAVASRQGLDLNPIDVHDEEAVLWLRALIWPDEAARAEQLQQAIAIARIDPPALVAGNALDTLPAAAALAPPDAALCIYHSYTVNQFPLEARTRLREILDEVGAERDLYVVSAEQLGGHEPRLGLRSYRGGVMVDERLAWCDAHGSWLEWNDSHEETGAPAR